MHSKTISRISGPGTVNLETEVSEGRKVEAVKAAEVGRGVGLETALIRETTEACSVMVRKLTIVKVAVRKKLKGLIDLVVLKTKSL
jgi:hypothetical protein